MYTFPIDLREHHLRAITCHPLWYMIAINEYVERLERAKQQGITLAESDAAAAATT